ncbi:MAG: penicillin-binding protein 2 [Clostridia bacterium]|nr:penicillin-binding protein 2 [Clostridia bacterium]
MLKRALSLYIFIIICFMAFLGRIVYIQRSEYSSVMESASKRTLIVGEKRGGIYDRNFSPLVDSENHLLAAVTPCVGSYEYLKGKLDDRVLRSRIEEGRPFICQIDEEINNEYIRTFSVSQRYSAEGLAVHLIGYCDSSGQTGITGIERAYNAYLSENRGKLSVTFDVDAVGRVLAGMDKTVYDNNYSSKAGVVLSIDGNVQKIAEDALENSKIKSGCAVVMHVHTGEILAMASVPEYDQNNVAASLKDENSPLVNKALTAYSVGSVFKPIVAAAALENGYDPNEEYECTGEIKVGDRKFACYNHKAHGKVNMSKALEDSCNTYFISLIMRTDSDLLLSLCRQIGLGEKDILAPSLAGSSGTLPTDEELKIKGNLANFAFGQGSLTATPLQITKAYHTLATGNYIKPQLIKGFTNYMGLMTKEPTDSAVKILSDETVIKIREMLLSVTEKGGADKAHSRLLSLAGKTGTAQSGIYIGGKEILRTWFAGFFPANNPHYIVVVLNENGSGGNTDCAPIFKEICEGIVS